MRGGGAAKAEGGRGPVQVLIQPLMGQTDRLDGIERKEKREGGRRSEVTAGLFFAQFDSDWWLSIFSSFLSIRKFEFLSTVGVYTMGNYFRIFLRT